MGLEDQPAFISRVFESAEDPVELKTKLAELGWKSTNYGFQLGRKTGAVDIQSGRQRLLIYVSPPEDINSYKRLEHYHLPVLSLVYKKPTINKEDFQSGLAVVSLPEGTRSFDFMRFQDQQPTTGYLGSIEIMVAIAKFLASIMKKTGSLPRVANLGNLALVPGENDLIRLVPPLDLIPAADWRYISEGLKQDLRLRDPQSDHLNQIEAFNRHFDIFLNQHG